MDTKISMSKLFSFILYTVIIYMNSFIQLNMSEIDCGHDRILELNYSIQIFGTGFKLIKILNIVSKLNRTSFVCE